MKPEWETEYTPDFTEHGFHTHRKVRFTLSDGRTITDVYQGWGIFGIGDGYTWKEGRKHGEVFVVAWQPVEDAAASAWRLEQIAQLMKADPHPDSEDGKLLNRLADEQVEAEKDIVI